MACRCFSVTGGSSSVLNVNFQTLRLCACGKRAGLTIRLESQRWDSTHWVAACSLLNSHRLSKCCRISLQALSSKVSKIHRCYRGSITTKEVYLCSRRMDACFSYLRMSRLQKEAFQKVLNIHFGSSDFSYTAGKCLPQSHSSALKAVAQTLLPCSKGKRL